MTALRDIRKRYGKTILECAQGIGVSVSYLSDVERGRRGMSVMKIYKMADILGCTRDERCFLVGVEVASLLPMLTPRGVSLVSGMIVSDVEDTIAARGGTVDRATIVGA